mgnify:CR=1 FL=1
MRKISFSLAHKYKQFFHCSLLIIHYSLNKAKIERGCVAASPENYIYHITDFKIKIFD